MKILDALHQRIADAKAQGVLTDALLAECEDAECSTCSVIVCPKGEWLHFHHDGCPACAMISAENVIVAPEQLPQETLNLIALGLGWDELCYDEHAPGKFARIVDLEGGDLETISLPELAGAVKALLRRELVCYTLQFRVLNDKPLCVAHLENEIERKPKIELTFMHEEDGNDDVALLRAFSLIVFRGSLKGIAR